MIRSLPTPKIPLQSRFDVYLSVPLHKGRLWAPEWLMMPARSCHFAKIGLGVGLAHEMGPRK